MRRRLVLAGAGLVAVLLAMLSPLSVAPAASPATPQATAPAASPAVFTAIATVAVPVSDQQAAQRLYTEFGLTTVFDEELQ